jgi:hypothetical protein
MFTAVRAAFADTSVASGTPTYMPRANRAAAHVHHHADRTASAAARLHEHRVAPLRDRLHRPSLRRGIRPSALNWLDDRWRQP